MRRWNNLLRRRAGASRTAADGDRQCFVGPVTRRLVDGIGGRLRAGPHAVAALTTSEDAEEGALEVAAGARVDDGVHHAVAVAEPEHDLEQPRRHVARAAQRFCSSGTATLTCQLASNARRSLAVPTPTE